jgi:hypothetical protein
MLISKSTAPSNVVKPLLRQVKETQHHKQIEAFNRVLQNQLALMQAPKVNLCSEQWPRKW